MQRAIAALIRVITGVRRLSGSPYGSGPAIFFANHTSHLDFAVVWAALPYDLRKLTSPAAAEDYWGKSRFRRWVACSIFNAVLIPREAIDRRNNPLTRLSSCLESGRSILIFPEGTRREKWDGEVQVLKPGLFHLAKRFPSLPLIPVQLENLNRILPKGTLVLVPLIAQTRFCRPVFFNPEEGRVEFLQRCRRALLPEETAAPEPTSDHQLPQRPTLFSALWTKK
jgi:1-acyl-sn-glycerol-3-phosphate acyltransferase